MGKGKGIGEIWFALFPLVSSLCRSGYYPVLQEAFGVEFVPKEGARSEKLGLRYDCLSKLARIAHQNPMDFIRKIEMILPQLEQINPAGASEVKKHLEELMYYLYYGNIQNIVKAVPQIAEFIGTGRGSKARISKAIRMAIERGLLPPLEQVRQQLFGGEAVREFYELPAPVQVTA